MTRSQLLSALSVSALLVVAGCSGEQLVVDQSKDVGSRIEAMHGGSIVESKQDGNRLCLSVNGLSLVWPKGTRVETDPLRVVAPSGRVMATVGEPSPRFGGTPLETGGCLDGGPAFSVDDPIDDPSLG